MLMCESLLPGEKGGMWATTTKERNSQTVCKPGSVRARRRWMTIHLGRSLPNASCNLPGQQRGDASAANRGCPYWVLLPWCFTMPA